MHKIFIDQPIVWKCFVLSLGIEIFECLWSKMGKRSVHSFKRWAISFNACEIHCCTVLYSSVSVNFETWFHWMSKILWLFFNQIRGAAKFLIEGQRLEFLDNWICFCVNFCLIGKAFVAPLFARLLALSGPLLWQSCPWASASWQIAVHG